MHTLINHLYQFYQPHINITLSQSSHVAKGATRAYPFSFHLSRVGFWGFFRVLSIVWRKAIAISHSKTTPPILGVENRILPR